MPYEYYFILAVIAGFTLICVGWTLCRDKWSHWKSGRMDQDKLVDARLAVFEQRVNDLQDILISIDDRLDRRLKRI